MNKLIKLEIWQEYAIYRNPFSFEIIETYPLPPFSTVIGLIHNILHLKNTLKGIKLCIQGKYDSLIRNFVRYKKYKSKKDQWLPYPIVETALGNVYLRIYVKMPDEENHQKLYNALKNPPYYLYLGRAEDVITFMKVEELNIHKLEKINEIEYIPLNIWIDENWISKFDFSKDEIKSFPVFFLNGYYAKNNPHDTRKWNRIKTYYISKNTALVLKDENDYFLAENDDGLRYPILLIQP